MLTTFKLFDTLNSVETIMIIHENQWPTVERFKLHNTYLKPVLPHPASNPNQRVCFEFWILNEEGTVGLVRFVMTKSSIGRPLLFSARQSREGLAQTGPTRPKKEFRLLAFARLRQITPENERR